MPLDKHQASKRIIKTSCNSQGEPPGPNTTLESEMKTGEKKELFHLPQRNRDKLCEAHIPCSERTEVTGNSTHSTETL